jgi:hypothetical protein
VEKYSNLPLPSPPIKNKPKKATQEVEGTPEHVVAFFICLIVGTDNFKVSAGRY